MSEAVQAPQASKEEQNWAMACHLVALAGFIIPFGNVLGPLIVWLIKKDTMPLVDQHGKEALNFQITLFIGYLASFVLMLVLIGFLTFFVVWIGGLVFMIMATMAANRGEWYRYPINLRLVPGAVG